MEWLDLYVNVLQEMIEVKDGGKTDVWMTFLGYSW